MKPSAFLRSRALLPRLHVPAALLIALLQRTPVIRALAAAEELVAATPLAPVLRAAFAAAASLGALHSLAGATVLSASKTGPVNLTVGTAMDPIGFTVTDTINIRSWKIGGSLPPGLTLAAVEGGTPLTGPGMLDATVGGGVTEPSDPYGGGSTGGGATSTTPVLRGTPTTAGNYTFTLQAFEFGGGTGLASNTFSYSVAVAGAVAAAPTFSAQPASQASTAGGNVTLTAAATGNPTFQWRRNGVDIANATSAAFALNNLQPATTGIYSVVVANSGGTLTSQPAIVGVTTTFKVIGSGSEIASDIVHPNKNIFDQVLIDGAAVSVTADKGQVLRTSFIDGSNDIVQVEFSGAGTVSIVLAGASGPALPLNYNQAVNYMKGLVGIVVTGADETSNLSVFSVGRGNAVNQALFKSDVTYDGMADIAFVAIASPTGKFGGLRTANASYFATAGYTGVYAPGVQFTGPVFIGDINATDQATPVIMLGSAADVRITGGDLEQANGRAIQVSGLTQLKMVDGSSSHFVDIATTPTLLFRAKTNRGRLEQNGMDVTAQIVVNPTN